MHEENEDDFFNIPVNEENMENVENIVDEYFNDVGEKEPLSEY